MSQGIESSRNPFLLRARNELFSSHKNIKLFNIIFCLSERNDNVAFSRFFSEKSHTREEKANNPAHNLFQVNGEGDFSLREKLLRVSQRQTWRHEARVGSKRNEEKFCTIKQILIQSLMT